MEKPDEASFISLPLHAAQANYVSLLGTHALRCNIIAELDPRETISAGILKIDAPSNPLKFVQHKGLALTLDRKTLMDKLGAARPGQEDFSADELWFLKLLFNEYVELAAFLLSSRRISPDLRLLLIFPRLNIFAVLRRIAAAIPAEEPQTLGGLAAYRDRLFSLPRPQHAKKTATHRIPERVIQARVAEAIMTLARDVLQHVYRPVTAVRRLTRHYAQSGYACSDDLRDVRQRIDAISSYLKRLNLMQGFVRDPRTGGFDLDASIACPPPPRRGGALEEIVGNIQAAEIEQTREVIVSKMLDYLSYVTVRVEQLEKVSSPSIKEELSREILQHTAAVLDQARSFYRLVAAQMP